MYVLIDTSEHDLITILLVTLESIHEHSVPAPNRHILHVLDACLREHDMSSQDVSGMMVVVGAGSFTSTRLATTVANTFAYVRQIPVLAISKEQAGDPQALIPELLKQPSGQYISATYSGSPNIGKA